jgi:hypothetical protein
MESDDERKCFRFRYKLTSIWGRKIIFLKSNDTIFQYNLGQFYPIYYMIDI